VKQSKINKFNFFPKLKFPKLNHGFILFIIWLIVAISDRLWYYFDQSVPAWDQADYLSASLNYWRFLQNPDWLSGTWWQELWMRSPKIPPLTYILTVPFLNIFGVGPDETTLVYLLFTAVLLIAVYLLGKKLFNSKIGLWAAVITMLLPGLYRFRLQFLLDYPLTTAITLSYLCFTYWWRRHWEPDINFNIHQKNWLGAILFGISFGLALLIKQTALFFLFTPIIWATITILKNKAWEKLLELIFALIITTSMVYPWARANWLLMITAGKRATIDSAIAESDPSLLTIDAWIYYLKLLPSHISLPLLFVPLIGLIFYLLKTFIHSEGKAPINIRTIQRNIKQNKPTLLINDAVQWLGIFLIGGYLISSLNINKDVRYTLALLPVIAILLSYFFSLYPRKYAGQIRTITIIFATILLILSTWPIGGVFTEKFTQFFNPDGFRRAYLGTPWPHEQVISTIIDREPFLRNNLGVLPSTPEINQHNLNYYGALRNKQVYGRQVGTKIDHIPQDLNSLNWFVTKSEQQGSVKRIKKAQIATVTALQNSPDFTLEKTWDLPDFSQLSLYHKKLLPVEVQPLQLKPDPAVLLKPQTIKLDYVMVANQVKPGQPLPISYQWSGDWQQLVNGIVLLTYQQTDVKPNEKPAKFIHDHAIGFGNLHPGKWNADQSHVNFAVTEKTALLPAADLPTGNYSLQATYLNRQTGESYSIPVSPPVNININPGAIALPAPELDLVTQLRVLGKEMQKGLPGLELAFEQIGRVNQYDPTQDYLEQAEKSLTYRLQQEPNNLDWAYALAFTNVLQQDAPGAITALEKVINLDPKNAFGYAYLGFVYLYDWQPQPAEKVLATAMQLNPFQAEIQALHGAALLFQGKIFDAWSDLQAIKRIKFD